MYFGPVILLLFFNTIVSSVENKEVVNSKKIYITASSLNRYSPFSIQHKIVQFPGYANEKTTSSIKWIERKIALQISSNSFLKTLLSMIYKKAEEIGKMSLFDLRFNILKTSLEEFVENIANKNKSTNEYIDEMQYIMKKLGERYAIITQYSRNFASFVQFLCLVEFSGVVIVECSSSKEIENVISNRKILSHSFFVAVEKQYILNTFNTLVNIEKSVFIDINLGPMKKEKPFSVLAGCFVFIGFVLIVSSAIYLLLSQRAQPIRRTKTVRNRDLQRIKLLPYEGISKEAKEIEELPRECIICFEKFCSKSVCRILPCNHFYHASCIDTWLINYCNRCPYCQTPITAS